MSSSQALLSHRHRKPAKSSSGRIAMRFARDTFLTMLAIHFCMAQRGAPSARKAHGHLYRNGSPSYRLRLAIR